ncbi:MAG: hypothetical protein IJI21_01720 [Clostridia bacterium]|nr:hypothetical protein [Clostridia bacterium]
MIFSGRKTIGVFLSKEFAVFDEAVFRALEAEDTIEGRIQKSDRLMYSRKEERHGETEKAEAKGREPGA